MGVLIQDSISGFETGDATGIIPLGFFFHLPFDVRGNFRGILHALYDAFLGDLSDLVVGTGDEVADVIDAVCVRFLDFLGLEEQLAENALLVNHLDIEIDVVGVDDRVDEILEIRKPAGQLVELHVDELAIDHLRIDGGVLLMQKDHRAENIAIAFVFIAEIGFAKRLEAHFRGGGIAKHRAEDGAFGFDVAWQSDGRHYFASEM